MSVKLFMWIGFIWIVATIAGLIGDGVFFGSNEVGILNYLTGYTGQEFVDVNFVGAIFSGVGMAVGFFTHGLIRLILFDYTYLTDNTMGVIIRFILYAVFSAGTVYGIFLYFRGRS